jgi:phosphotransferase system  glucose/maltose/N-acetylglucosamine-specific IIC component
MMGRKILFVCSAILFAIALYLHITNSGFLHSYKGRGSLPIYTETVAISSESVFLMALIVLAMALFAPKSYKYFSKEYNKKERARKEEERKKFERYKNRKYN